MMMMTMMMDHSLSSMALEVLSHMLPKRVLNPCPAAHQSMAGNSIHAWQHQPNNHLLATHVLCPRRNLEVSAVVTPCISCRAISFFLISSLTLSLSLYLSLLLSSKYFIPTGWAVLEGVSLWMKITSLQILKNAGEINKLQSFETDWEKFLVRTQLKPRSNFFHNDLRNSGDYLSPFVQLYLLVWPEILVVSVQ